ncbi:hypothetical protein HYR54_16955 [Candidatus Acetothermia bacterium]|nr:hypothetical protein [Candidatus Acetothermia bacterium]MBI3459587.1 hypothetical protein [Candidatus Acetothermia bacterium]MBI3659843.1 hypothetical protein [Candidatus Acetothermia bacterium]
MFNYLNRSGISFVAVLSVIFICGFPARANHLSTTVVSIVPAIGTPGQSMTVQVIGTGFAGVRMINFGPGVVVQSFAIRSSNVITSAINISNNAVIGSRVVNFITADGVATVPALFTIRNGLVVTNLSANIGRPGQTMTLAILGSGFTGANALSFGQGVTVRSFNVMSDRLIVSRIHINVLAPLGSRPVTVVAPIGIVTVPSMFTVSWRASILPTCNVGIVSSPDSVPFRYVQQRRTIDITLFNQGPSTAVITAMAAPLGAIFFVESILPSLPLALPPGTQQTFRLSLRGTAIGVVSAPFVGMNLLCTFAAFVSEAGAFVPSMTRHDDPEKPTIWAELGQLSARTQGEDIPSVQVRVFDTNGRLLLDQAGDSREQSWILPTAQLDGKPFARGVYLVVITLRDATGAVIRSEAKKLILRR